MKIHIMNKWGKEEKKFVREDIYEWDGSQEKTMSALGEGIWQKFYPHDLESYSIYIDLDNPNLKLHKSWSTTISDAINIIRDKKISQIL